MRQVISVLYELAEQGGGVTRVSLGRTAALAELGVLASIAVLGYDEKLDKTLHNLVQQRRVSETLKVVNYYRWFSHKAFNALSAAPVCAQSTVEHLRVPVKKRVDHINGMNISISRYMTAAGYVFMEEFLDRNSSVVMVIVYMPGARPLKFNSLESAHAYWLKCLSAECLPSFLIADSIGAADTVCRVQGEGIYRILMMHSNHLLKPHVVGAPIAPKYDGVIRGLHNAIDWLS